MKQRPKGSKFITTEMEEVEFFKDVLTRLENDVGTYFQMLDKFYPQGKITVGFWASLRMIFPIVESIAHITSHRPPEFLEKYLDIKTGHLAWDLFRHSLVHGDYLMEGKYKNNSVKWGVMVGEGKHDIQNGHIRINTRYLYKKLVEYLKAEIDNNNKQKISIERGVEYTSPKTQIIKDFSKLIKQA